ncbi:MAG: hypothetical protein LBM92_05345, partial [Opitutaceae bacterium]|nr:hypothetical protein [Opitutaceae bacterium]
LARLQRKKSLLRRHDEHLDFRAGHRTDALLDHLRSGGPDATAALFTAQTGLAAFIDSLRRDGSRSVIPVSHHTDELRRVETGYGASERPADYLESFAAWLRENSNTIPALVIVTRRPRDLTRAQLRELALALDAAGFSETYLRNAWRDARQEDAAATIIGFIRAQAIGSPLVPYEERVRRALKSILHGKRYQWTAPQRKWLERIGRYFLDEVVVDRDTFASGRLRDIGGFAHVDRTFDGHLAVLLGDLQEEIWRDTA